MAFSLLMAVIITSFVIAAYSGVVIAFFVIVNYLLAIALPSL